MEFLGSAFGQPLTDDSLHTMEFSLEIYRRWLGLGCKSWSERVVVPDFARGLLQHYFQEIIRHLSQIFEKRAVPSISLCCITTADRGGSGKVLRTLCGRRANLQEPGHRDA